MHVLMLQTAEFFAGGGHRSDENYDDLLQRNPNLVECVCGAIGSAAGSADLCNQCHANKWKRKICVCRECFADTDDVDRIEIIDDLLSSMSHHKPHRWTRKRRNGLMRRKWKTRLRRQRQKILRDTLLALFRRCFQFGPETTMHQKVRLKVSLISPCGANMSYSTMTKGSCGILDSDISF